MKKAKILLVLALIILMISSYCYATDDTEVLEGEEAGEGIVLDDAILNAITNGAETNQTNVQAQGSQNNNWVNSDVYIFEDSVTLTDVVDGNAFIMAKEVTIKGEVGGDLFVIAEKVNVEGGYIYSNIFVLAKEVNIDGIVYDLYGMCDTLNLKSNGYVYRDMRVEASTVNLNGTVRRNAYIVSKDLNFDQTVGTIIYGNLEYTSNEDSFTAPEGTVEGTVTYNTQSINAEKSSFASVIFKYIVDLLTTVISTLVIVLLLLWLAPKFIDKLGNMSVGKSFASLGIGFVTPVIFIIVGIILLMINIGSEIFFAGLFGYMFLSVIGFAITSIFFTKLLAKKVKIEGKMKFILFTLLIAAVLWLVDQLPLIGGLTSFLAWAFGTGAILLNIIPKKEETK